MSIYVNSWCIAGQYETDEKDKTLIDEHDAFDKNVLKSFTKNKAFKTRHKLKAHTSKIVSSFKTPSITCSLVKEYKVSNSQSHFESLVTITISLSFEGQQRKCIICQRVE